MAIRGSYEAAVRKGVTTALDVFFLSIFEYAFCTNLDGGGGGGGGACSILIDDLHQCKPLFDVNLIKICNFFQHQHYNGS